MGSPNALADLHAAAEKAGIASSIEPAFPPQPGVVVNALEFLKIILSKDTAEVLGALALVLYQVRQIKRGRRLTFLRKQGDSVVSLVADRLTTDQMTAALNTCEEIVLFDETKTEHVAPLNDGPAMLPGNSKA
jgi:hypothetical protein